MKTLARIAKTTAAALLAAFSTASIAYAAFDNPLGPQASDIPSFISTALKALVVIALPIITLFIVISGFMFVAARGNEGKLAKAKENFVYVIIGACLILGAWVLATLIGGTVSQVVGTQ